jgi:hypothetical protein
MDNKIKVENVHTIVLNKQDKKKNISEWSNSFVDWLRVKSNINISSFCSQIQELTRTYNKFICVVKKSDFSIWKEGREGLKKLENLAERLSESKKTLHEQARYDGHKELLNFVSLLRKSVDSFASLSVEAGEDFSKSWVVLSELTDNISDRARTLSSDYSSFKEYKNIKNKSKKNVPQNQPISNPISRPQEST